MPNTSPDPRQVVRLPGQLTFDGVSLGATFRQRWLPNARYYDETAEEFGSITVNTWYVGSSPVLLGLLRTWNAAAVAEIFPQGADGNVRSGGDRPGAEISVDKGGVLLFTPDDSTQPSIRLYRAVPLLQTAAELSLRADQDMGIGFAFRVTPDSRGRTYKCAVGA